MISLLLNDILESWIDPRKFLFMDCSQKIAPLSGKCFTECSSRFLVAHDAGKISNERRSGCHTRAQQGKFVGFLVSTDDLEDLEEMLHSIITCQSSRWSNIRELLPKSLKLNIYGDSATFPLDKTKPSVLASHFDLLDVENSLVA